MSDKTEGTPAPAPAPTWPRVITLKHPFDYGSEHVSSITMRRGKMGDLKGMKLADEVPMEQLTTIASRLSGRPVAVIDLLDADDAGEVMEISLDFYGKCLGGGKKL